MTKNEFAAKLGKNVDIKALMAEIADAEDDNAVLEILKRYNVELTAEDVRSLIGQEDELDENALDDVAGGCKCRGILKRLVTNFLCWLSEYVTGNPMTCPDCGH